MRYHIPRDDNKWRIICPGNGIDGKSLLNTSCYLIKVVKVENNYEIIKIDSF